MRLCRRGDGIGALFIADGDGGRSSRECAGGDGWVGCGFGGKFVMFHEFVLPVPTNAIFDPVNVVGHLSSAPCPLK